MNTISSRILAALLLVGSAMTAVTHVHAQDAGSEATFEFLKATENRVWRLNRETGEIAVCTLERDALLCSTSSGAAETPATTYEELKQREAAELAAAQEKEQQERERAIKLIDRMVEVFKEFTAEATAK